MDGGGGGRGADNGLKIADNSEGLVRAARAERRLKSRFEEGEQKTLQSNRKE